MFGNIIIKIITKITIITGSNGIPMKIIIKKDKNV